MELDPETTTHSIRIRTKTWMGISPQGGNTDAGLACGNAMDTSSGGRLKYELLGSFCRWSAQQTAQNSINKSQDHTNQSIKFNPN